MIKQNIETLLASDATSYQISKYTGLSTQLIDKYRDGKSKIGNMTLDVAIELNSFYEDYKNPTASIAENIKMDNAD